MVGAGGADLAGEIGGEETTAGAASRETGAAGPADNSSAPAGLVARESVSVPLRLPNTVLLHAGGLLCPQFLDQGRQERGPWLLGFAAAGQSLRYLQKNFGGAVVGGDFRDHLPIVGGGAEDLRVERD